MKGSIRANFATIHPRHRNGGVFGADFDPVEGEDAVPGSFVGTVSRICLRYDKSAVTGESTFGMKKAGG